MKKMAITTQFILLSFSVLLGAANGYEVGKEYVYTYNGKVQVTQPEVKMQSAGLAFRSTVVVQPRPTHTHFKVVDFEEDLVNSDDIDFDTHEFQYEPHPSLLQNLGRAFAATFANGKFENIELAKDEPMWSQNMKKALAGLFQVELTAHEESPQAGEYTVLEDGVHGVCETLYVLSPNSRHGHGSLHEHVGQGEEHHFLTELTKVRNLEKCSHPHIAFHGSFRGEKCGDCVSKDTPPFVQTAEVKYALRGSPHGFVIEHACSSASQVYIPFNEGKVVTAFVNRTLRLVEERDAATDTTLPEELQVHTTLKHALPVSENVHTPEDLKRNNAFVDIFELSTDYEKALQVFDQLVHIDFTEADYKDAVHKDSPAEKFLQTFHAFRGFPYEKFGTFYEHVAGGPDGQQHDARNLFLDLLGAAGTNPAVAFGLHLIQSGQLSVPEAKRFLSRLPYSVKEPSEGAVHAIIDTCKTDFVKADDGLKASCLMAVGSIIEYSCDRAKTDEETDGRLCHPDIVSRFYNHSVTYEGVLHQSYELGSVYAEIGGKLGTRHAFRCIARFVEPSVPCHRTRLTNLWALVPAGKWQPDLVRQIALPIYKNTSESYELRIAAFSAVMVTDPDLYLLRHIGRAIIDDPSDQLASYVTSFFREFAKSDYPCFKRMARKFRYVVPLWNHVKRFKKAPDFRKSRVTVSSGYDPKYNYGGMTVTSVVRSEDSDIPRSIFVGAMDYVAGFNHDSVSITYQGHGVDKLLDRLYGPRPGSKRNLWGFYPRSRETRDAKERKEIEDQLPITPRTYAPFEVNLKVDIFGHTVYNWAVSEKDLESLMRPGTEGSGQTPGELITHLLAREYRAKHFYMARDMLWVFPTDLGILFFMDVKQANFIYANRHQATFEHVDDKFHLGYQRHYVYDSSAYEILGFELTQKKVVFGVGYNKRTAVSLPLTLSATYDLATHQFSLERPLGLPLDLLNYKFHPYTFVEGFDKTVTDLHPYAEYPLTALPLYRNEEQKDYERTYFADVLGYGLYVKSQLIKRGLRQGLHHFWHEMDWRQRFYYLYVNPHWHPRSLTLQIVPAEADPTHSIQEDIEYTRHSMDDGQGLEDGAHADHLPAGGREATVHVLNADVTLKGPTRNRSVAIRFTYSHSKNMLKHHVTFLYDRTPFRQSEQSNKKICLDTTVTFPAPEWTRLEKLGGFYHGKKIDATANLAYGTDCATGSRISAHGTYEHTDADAEEIENIINDTPESRDRFQQKTMQALYRKCRLDQERGVFLNNYCTDYMYHSSRLGKLNLDVEYHNLRPLLPPHHHYHEHIKGHAGFFHVVASHFTGPDGRLHVVSQVPAFQGGRYADVTVTVPANDTDGADRIYHHHDVPTFSHLLEPRTYDLRGYTNLEEYSTRFKHELCDIQGGAVRTFDGLLALLPETDCFKVVARDCSPDSQFVVLARALPSFAFPKALKMFIGDIKIDILPLSNDSGPIFRVDGQQMEVPPGQHYSHHVNGDELFYVENVEKYFIIMSEARGVFVVFNGQVLFVQAAPYYRGKLCGLCGDYNFERQREFRGPDLRLYHDRRAFTRSYVIPSEDCTV